jgi:hypothetical protein
MAQIRCRHIPLNAHLFRIESVDLDLCQKCYELEENLHCQETVKHFLFECPSLSQEREKLVEAIGRSHLNLKDIMLKTDCMSALASFIIQTGRFKSIKAEKPIINKQRNYTLMLG